MGVNSAAIRKMVELGLSAVDIADLCDLLDDGGVPDALEKRRAYDRERKRAKGNSTGNPPEPVTTPNASIPPEIHRKSTGNLASRVVNNPLPSVITGQSKEESSLRSESSEPRLELVVLDGEPIPRSRFEEGWLAYPTVGRRRASKAGCSAVWMREARKAGGEGELLAAIKRFARSPESEREGGKYVPSMERWLKKSGWSTWTADDPEGDQHVASNTGPRTRGDQRLDGLRRFDAIARATLAGGGGLARGREDDLG